MKTVAVIQARMGSTRLPEKVMADIGGRSMLARVVRRTERARLLSEVAVATTTRPGDDAIVEECEALGVRCFRGNEEDVLDRYHEAAHRFTADAVVRITADCPLIDPEVTDSVVSAFKSSNADYASNILERSFPRGLDVEVFSLAALDRTWEEATNSHQRAHVTPYMYESPSRFELESVRSERDMSHLRWTVDTSEDLEVVRALYAQLGNGDGFSWRDALHVVENEPDRLTANRDVVQKRIEEC
jgi:spore coat polysaccharide biosynthesis protein SpsF